MKHNHTRSRGKLVLLALVALFVACGDNLIADPSFDLWCGSKLCKPWKVSGSGQVTRVKTWHSNDYGVSLDDDTVLSQLSTHDPVECIAFEVIADVSASADVWLEMDFRDDGVSEYKQLIAESHFTKLRYLVKAPTWYDSLRFILRKKGDGRAVLAQIKATPSDECKGDALELLERPQGASCEDGAQCAEAKCTKAPAQFAEGFEEPEGDAPVLACGECDSTEDCAKGEVCSVGVEDARGYAACLPEGSLEHGMWCLSNDDCSSKLCSVAAPLIHASCAQCETDADCASGEICGVLALPLGAARSCHTDTTRALGELCAVDAECKSGVCCEGSCSECCKGHACKGGAKCGFADQEWLTSEPSLCDPGAGKRKRGAACAANADCASGDCNESDAICHLCQGEACADNADDCGFLRKLAGTCR